MTERHSSEHRHCRGGTNTVHEFWQLGRRVACVALLAIALTALVKPALADPCSSARDEEQRKLEDYLAKELSYKVAKFTINWIEAKRAEFSLSSLLASDMAQAESSESQIELEGGCPARC